MPLLFYRLVKALGTTGVRAIGGFWNVLLQTSKLIAMLILALQYVESPFAHPAILHWLWHVAWHCWQACMLDVPTYGVASQIPAYVSHHEPQIEKVEAMGMCYFLIK